jgi:hypothetical protein
MALLMRAIAAARRENCNWVRSFTFIFCGPFFVFAATPNAARICALFIHCEQHSARRPAGSAPQPVSPSEATASFLEKGVNARERCHRGLAVRGTMLVIGAAPSLEVPPFFLLSGCRSVKGWYSGTSIDSQDTLAFSVHAGVRSMNEVFPLERVAEGYERMMSGEARFRVVLTMGR